MIKKYSKYVFELIAIFIAVMLSFIVENYRIDLEKSNDLDAILRVILKDLKQDSLVLSTNKSRYELFNEIDKDVLSDNPSTPESIRKFTWNLYGSASDYFSTMGYNLLQQSSVIDALDMSIASQLNEYYDIDIRAFKVKKEFEVRSTFNIHDHISEILPYRLSDIVKNENSKSFDHSSIKKLYREPSTYNKIFILNELRINNKKINQDLIEANEDLRQSITEYLKNR